MKIGPLFFGWHPLPESNRIDLGLDPWPAGWEAFYVEWNDRGFMTTVRPRIAAMPSEKKRPTPTEAADREEH